MIAYCPLEDLEPPIRQQKPVVKPNIDEVKVKIGHEETELNYVIMGFIAGVVLLAVSDTVRT